MQLFQKSYSKDTWPAISFTGDESSALHLVTNAVNVYDPADFASGELVAPSVSAYFLHHAPLACISDRHEQGMRAVSSI